MVPYMEYSQSISSCPCNQTMHFHRKAEPIFANGGIFQMSDLSASFLMCWDLSQRYHSDQVDQLQTVMSYLHGTDLVLCLCLFQLTSFLLFCSRSVWKPALSSAEVCPHFLLQKYVLRKQPCQTCILWSWPISRIAAHHLGKKTMYKGYILPQVMQVYILDAKLGQTNAIILISQHLR